MPISKILRIATYSLVSLVTLELAARVDDFLREQAPLLRPYSINTLFRPSALGKEGVPSAKYAKWQMNSLGYRGPEPISGRANILVFGASESFGLYESANHEYPRIVEKTLNEKLNNRFNVINIAMPGIRIGRVTYLDAAVQKTQPQFVIVYPSPANYIGTTTAFCGQPARPVADQRTLADYSRFVGKAVEMAKKIAPEAVRNALGKYTIWSASREQKPVEKMPVETLAAMEKDFGCVIDTIRAAGSKPIIVTHATFFGATFKESDRAMLTAWRRFYPNMLEDGFIDLERRTNELIVEIGRRQGVPVVDAANVIPGGPEYFADFVHFTDKGAKTMADLIANKIIEQLNQPDVNQPNSAAK
jgi:hypothetical protein